MSAEPLRATAAARRLGLSTSELLRLIHDREIRFVMVDGIAHVPEDAIDEYEARGAGGCAPGPGAGGARARVAR